MRYLFIALLFAACITDDDEPVCEDVKTEVGYCYIPFPGNIAKGFKKQCGFATIHTCNSHLEIGVPENHVSGTCEPEYEWKRQCK